MLGNVGRFLRRAGRNLKSGVSDVFQGSTYAQMGRDIERDVQGYVENPEAFAIRGLTALGTAGLSEGLIGASRALGQSGIAQGVLGRGADPYAYAMESAQKAVAQGLKIGNQPGAPTGDEPPGYNYENDPNFQQQFSRLRKAARVLGRAGTYRNRGASSLGTDSPLGTPMQLTGA